MIFWPLVMLNQPKKWAMIFLAFLVCELRQPFENRDDTNFLLIYTELLSIITSDYARVRTKRLLQ